LWVGRPQRSCPAHEWRRASYTLSSVTQAPAQQLSVDEKFAKSSSSDENYTATSVSEVFQELLRQSIAINSTAFEGGENDQRTFIGSKTETALLVMAKDHLGMGAVAEERWLPERDDLQYFRSLASSSEPKLRKWNAHVSKSFAIGQCK
jgi:hypothetical protein